jgi:hypothetical protein
MTAKQTQAQVQKKDKVQKSEKDFEEMKKQIEALQARNAELEKAETERLEAEKRAAMKEKLASNIAIAVARVKQSCLKDEKTRTVAQKAAQTIAVKPSELVERFKASSPITLGTIQGSHVQDGLLGIRLAMLIQQDLFPKDFAETMKNDALFDFETKCKQGKVLQEAGLLQDPQALIS